MKEMEKMKNKREEKRAQNSEIRIKQAQEYDSSIPNWEFARMIKEFRVTMECHPLTVTDPVSIPESLPPPYLSRTGRTLKDKEKACVILTHS